MDIRVCIFLIEISLCVGSTRDEMSINKQQNSFRGGKKKWMIKVILFFNREENDYINWSLILELVRLEWVLTVLTPKQCHQLKFQ